MTDDDPLRGAGPDQPDRRAHRLQPGFRAADRASGAHRRDVMSPDDGDAIVVRSDREDGEVAIPLDTAPGDVDRLGRLRGRRGVGAAPAPAIRSAAARCRSPATSRWARGCRRRRHWSARCSARWPAAAGLRIDRIEQARIAQRAENDYVGAPTGLMDQLASLCGEPRQALLIDFRDATVAPGAVRSRRRGRRAAADQLACAASSCRRRVRGAAGVLRTRRRRSRRRVAAGGAGPRACRRSTGGHRSGRRPARPPHPDREPAGRSTSLPRWGIPTSPTVGPDLHGVARLDARRLRDHHRPHRPDRRHRGRGPARSAPG